MNRKDIVLTDDNYDEWHEKLCDANGWSYSQDSKFVTNLPPGFSKEDAQKETDYDYCKVTVEPNIAIDSASAIEHYQMAFEFKNGFLIIYERNSMMD